MSGSRVLEEVMRDLTQHHAFQATLDAQRRLEALQVSPTVEALLASERLRESLMPTRLETLIAEQAKWYRQVTVGGALDDAVASLTAASMTDATAAARPIQSALQQLAQVEVPTWEFPLESSLLRTVAEGLRSLQDSPVFDAVRPLRELASLVPAQEPWVAQFSAGLESVPTADLRAFRPGTFDLDRTALLQLTAPAADDRGLESGERAAAAVGLLTEIVVRTPIPDGPATVDGDTPEARFTRFVVWWRGLNPAAQLTLALVFQWLTLGLAAEYLRAYGMLPGLDPEHPDSPE